ncbi:hypothetical protein EV401DRAFT_1883092 [Pisolithus croceorrhizus]|nr:hypothetical protein EV401DRAFT_1883092 [Pisolithus croceorrhizus]
MTPHSVDMMDLPNHIHRSLGSGWISLLHPFTIDSKTQKHAVTRSKSNGGYIQPEELRRYLETTSMTSVCENQITTAHNPGTLSEVLTCHHRQTLRMGGGRLRMEKHRDDDDETGGQTRTYRWGPSASDYSRTHMRVNFPAVRGDILANALLGIGKQGLPAAGCDETFTVWIAAPHSLVTHILAYRMHAGIRSTRSSFKCPHRPINDYNQPLMYRSAAGNRILGGKRGYTLGTAERVAVAMQYMFGSGMRPRVALSDARLWSPNLRAG